MGCVVRGAVVHDVDIRGVVVDDDDVRGGVDGDGVCSCLILESPSLSPQQMLTLK